MKRILTTLLAALFVLASLPVGLNAERSSSPKFLPSDYEQLNAFLQNETGMPGVSNADVIFDVGDIAQYHGWIYSPYYVVPFAKYSPVQQTPGEPLLEEFSFEYDYWYGVEFADPVTGEIICADIIDTIKPDAYGELNLSGTSVRCVCSPDAGQTHISGVIVDNCERLTDVNFNAQSECAYFSAVNCPVLAGICIMDCPLREIVFSPKGMQQVTTARVEGEGSMGFSYSSSPTNSEVSYSLYAENNGEFRGWYVNGRLVSTESMLLITGNEGIDIVACYTDDYSPVLLGDVDGDGSVTLADAIHVARCAIGVSTLSAELPNAETAADFDGNGRIDMTDAILIARVAIGVA